MKEKNREGKSKGREGKKGKEREGKEGEKTNLD